MKPSLPKGTRDFSPAQIIKRNYIFDTIKSIYKLYGYQPIETPAMENLETLTGKYGDEGDKLIFKILDSGDFIKIINSKSTRMVYELFIRKSEGLKIGKIKIFHNKFSQSIININKKKLIINNDLKEFLINEIKIDYKFLFKKNTMQVQSSISTFEISFFESLKLDIIDFMVELIKTNNDSIPRIIYYFNEFNKKEIAVQFEIDVLYNYFSKSEKVINYLGLNNDSLESKEIAPEISEKALRYDLTVPFARYVVQNLNDITFPFKRYQIQPVWRADRPQKGRYREFYQCDADVIGSNSLVNEIELIQIIDEVFDKLKLPVTVKLNNRKILSGIANFIGYADKMIDITVAIDKLDKMPIEKVCDELLQKGIDANAIEKLKPFMLFKGNNIESLNFLKHQLTSETSAIKGIEEIEYVVSYFENNKLKNTNLEIDLSLARGLNYYTGCIIEVKANAGSLSVSVCGGGRYDDLTGIFGLPNVSGVGISFGADRIYDILEELNLFPKQLETTQVLIVPMSKNELPYALQSARQLRASNIATEVYADEAKMKKQMTFANNKQIPFVIIIGEDELASGLLTIKNMETGEQQKIGLESVIQQLSQ